MSCYIKSYDDTNANPKNEHDCHETSVNKQSDCHTSHQKLFHAHQPKYQENVLATQQFVKSKQFNPTNCFCKEQTNENSLIVEIKINPISSGSCVDFGTKLKDLIAFFVEIKQQDDSVHLFTVTKRNKLKSTHEVLSIEYIFSHKEI